MSPLCWMDLIVLLSLITTIQQEHQLSDLMTGALTGRKEALIPPDKLHNYLTGRTYFPTTITSATAPRQSTAPN